MNVIVVSGNLVGDPELKITPNGVSVCSFSVAVKRPMAKDITDFFKVVSWRGTAEFISKYFRKGQKIEITGYLTQRRYTDKNGVKGVSIEIQCTEVDFGSSKKQLEPQEIEEPEEDDFVPCGADDDLPF